MELRVDIIMISSSLYVSPIRNVMSLITDTVCRKGVSERGIEFLTCSTSNQDPLCCQSISYAGLHNRVADIKVDFVQGR